MHVSFVIPPPELRVGGLDTAIFLLKDALEQDDRVTVTCDTESPSPHADVVHFHGLWMPSHVRAYQRCRKRSVPYVVSPHGMLEPWALRSKRWKKLPYFKLVDRSHLRRSQAIFVTSPIERRNVRTLTSCHQIEELPLGLAEEVPVNREEARAKFGLEPSDRVLLYLSRIDPKKGLDRLLSALEDTAYERWQLWIVGDGPDRWTKQLKDQAASKRRRLPPIHWLGPQWGEKKWPYMAAADLFCLPTHSENFGMSVLESLWVGTPVLTSPQTPWADFSDRDGFTITDNEVSSLHAALQTHFTNYAWTATQRQQLQAWSQHHFHWNQLRERYLTAYASLIGPAA